MNKIIKINDWELADVAGGCHCHCFFVPPNWDEPTTYIGVSTDDSGCKTDCTSHGHAYYKCSSVAPQKPRPLSDIERKLCDETVRQANSAFYSVYDRW